MQSPLQKKIFRPRIETLEHRDTPATLGTGFVEKDVAIGLNRPTVFAFVPDGRILIAEQGGTLAVVKNGQKLASPAINLTSRINSEGERGLIGVAIDPAFATNRFVYLHYTTTVGGIHNRVSRFQMQGDTLALSSEKILIDMNRLSDATNHNGGSMHFGRDGKLYVGVGDNADGANSQVLTNLLGKILRINSDGTIPSDNPFFNTAQGVNRAIWAFGFRNPYTFAVQRTTGRIFVNDVGAGSFEEIDDLKKGGNYGWPTTEGPTTDPRFIGPFHSYAHGSSSTTGFAITGGDFYNPVTNRYPTWHKGDYFYTDYISGWILRLDVATKKVTSFASNIPLPVDLHVGNDGKVYYLSLNNGGSSGFLRSIDYVPDLTWSGGSFTAPSRVLAGASFSVQRTYDVRGIPVPKSFAIRYIASRDAIRGNADDILLRTETISAASGRSVGLHSGTVGNLRITQKGTYTIFAVLDALRGVGEVFETNNVIRASTKITVA